MSSNDKIRLLIVNDSRSEAERLISMLENAGRPSRAQHVESEEGLIKLVQEHTWDLLIAHDQAKSVPSEIILKQVRRLSRDIPVILQTEDETNASVVEGLKLGAADVVRLDDDQHLLLVMQRELNNLTQRQQKRAADRRFREAERRSQALLDSSRDAIAYVQDGLYLYANESFSELFGYDDKDDIDYLPIMDMVAQSDQDKLKSFLKTFTLKGEEAQASKLEFEGVKQNGEATPISLEVSSATYDEEPCIQFLARARMVENNEELEEQLQQLKLQDQATGIHNKAYMLEHLEKIAGSAERDQSLLYIDLDNFQDKVHNALGVAAVDRALKDVAELLSAQLKPGEVLARFADHAFTLLLPDTHADAAIARAENLTKVIEAHIIDIDNTTVQLTASTGIALINDNTTNAGSAIEQALQATEKARAEGGNRVHLYEPELSPEEKAEKDVVRDIQNALDNDRFRLLFQPIISLRGSEDEYYEVLLRMLNEKDEEVSPAQFIETANKIGVGTKIDRWVTLEAIKMLSDHRAKGNKTKLVINLSKQSLCDENLLPWLGVAFKAAKLSPEAIIFQASENDITSHLKTAKILSQGLKKLKSNMVISNFGCALTPFKTLEHIAADYIKIDGSFTQDIQQNPDNPEGLVKLLEQLLEQGKTTIVPYVENAAVLSTLWQAGVHYIQGYYLQEPTASMDYDFNTEG
ncbi:EAL domain-containing response regulator [Marinimicrobium alkaliphilum]|uniref:EAL domain-containing response regulator n=1 Tax=Marinimicrobium alkaliphilum TaxID=2202654 RepID=UPI000DB8FF69|nr:EAL domain-containing protein [Marinimicrobium alkaliphilum]